jgi:hypothetical protein
MSAVMVMDECRIIADTALMSAPAAKARVAAQTGYDRSAEMYFKWHVNGSFCGQHNYPPDDPGFLNGA